MFSLLNDGSARAAFLNRSRFAEHFPKLFFLTNKTTEQITHSTLEKDLNNPMCSAAKHQLKTTVVHSLIWQTSFLLVIFAKHREKSEREIRRKGMQKCENLEKKLSIKPLSV